MSLTVLIPEKLYSQTNMKTRARCRAFLTGGEPSSKNDELLMDGVIQILFGCPCQTVIQIPPV